MNAIDQKVRETTEAILESLRAHGWDKLPLRPSPKHAIEFRVREEYSGDYYHHVANGKVYVTVEFDFRTTRTFKEKKGKVDVLAVTDYMAAMFGQAKMEWEAEELKRQEQIDLAAEFEETMRSLRLVAPTFSALERLCEMVNQGKVGLLPQKGGK